MALRRAVLPIDGTIPVPALLYDNEEAAASQDGVGIYDGLQKAPNHQAGTVHVSSHRLFYVDSQNPYRNSFVLDLSNVIQTDYYAGLFKSSPKITIHLSGNPARLQATSDTSDDIYSSGWECQVCGNRNLPGLSSAALRVCGLCGVPHPPVPSVASQHLSMSLPSTPALALPSDLLACPTCTFLNHSSLLHCEICETELPPVKTHLGAKSAPSSRPSSPYLGGEGSAAPYMIKLSFRKGGDKSFYAILKRCLKGKAWEASRIAARTSVLDSSPPAHRHTPGISGILKTVENSVQGQESGMQSALKDLEALMVEAKAMVSLAADLNEKLTAAAVSQSSAPHPSSTPMTTSSYASQTSLGWPVMEPEEATFVRSSLSQLGLQMPNAPVTLDMIKDERKWIDELARELAGVLQGSDKHNTGGIMRDRGVIALDEVWGGWNRARGVALIPPQILLQVIPQLPQYSTPPIQIRVMSSGLQVLHTPRYTQVAFAARLNGMLALAGPKTTGEIAREEETTTGLVGEMIQEVEKVGGVCRDDIGKTGMGAGGESSGRTGEMLWWNNIFTVYIWDGQRD